MKSGSMPLIFTHTLSGGTRKFFVGGNKGAKYVSEGVKIQKIAENG